MRHNRSFAIDLNSCMGGDAWCGQSHAASGRVCSSGNSLGLGEHVHAQGKRKNKKRKYSNRNKKPSLNGASNGVIGHQCNPGPVNTAAATALKIIRKRMAAGHRRAGCGVHSAPNSNEGGTLVES